MANAFVHVELNTTDLATAKSFYAKLFDWQLNDVPMPDSDIGSYTIIGVGGTGTAGGMLKNPVPGAGSFWLAYVAVDDVAATTEKAKSLGAKVLRDVTPVQGMGKFTIIEDPTGATIALWQAVT